ncbi:MAG: cysteine--tRNA ligase [Leptospiraceae bacterium]|nr:cysteine--tRNA ligase [Leptospiraceae bacterium]
MKRQVRFYNSLSGKKEDFIPKDSKNVKVYSCGPTVYNYSHIGNLRSYLFVDILRRSLKLLGFKLNQTMNITDIDDKIINQSIEKNIPIEEFTGPWIDAFFKDLEIMNVEKLEHYPKATESIETMLSMIDELKKHNMVYEKEGSVYFSISKFSNYGTLSKIDISGMKTGARYDSDEYEKDNARDFVLWKAPKLKKEKFWDTRHGKGRPGWHLECSAMIRDIYKSGIDIHTGGIDLLFPHHENEIAQSEGAFPDEKFVNYWLHCEHLLVEGEKMSKSLGNFFTLKDLLEKKYDPKAIRYLLISFHYRTKLNFSLKRLEESSKAIERIQNTLVRVLEKINFSFTEREPTDFAKESFESFLNYLADDLNTPSAIAEVFEFLPKVNSSLDKDSLNDDDLIDIASYFVKINGLLGVLNFEKPSEETDEEIEALIEKRKQAKANKDYKMADSIRDELLEKGIILEDTKDGVKWKRK